MLTLSKKSFIGASIGTMIEYYDYALFSIFLPIISPVFFPGKTNYESLIKSYIFLSLTMLVRPLGGLFFGYIGDRFGRRKALLSSMYGIAIATAMIGLTPSYATLGIASIIIIIIAKSVQLACFGGEYNGAGIYVVEHTNTNNEGLAASILTAMTLSGSLAASLIGIVTTYDLMPAWSWRIAFVLGGIVGVFAIFYRKNMQESPQFTTFGATQYPFKTLVKQFPTELITGICIGGSSTVPFSTVLLFIMPVLTTKGYMTHHQFMITQAFLILIAVITLMGTGFLSNRISSFKLMRASTLFLAIATYPLLLLTDHQSMATIITVSILLVIANEVFLGPVNAYYKNLFPAQYRYRGSSISFCLGMSIFGGLTQITESCLYEYTGHLSAVSIWIIIVSFSSFIMLGIVQRKTTKLLATTENTFSPFTKSIAKE